MIQFEHVTKSYGKAIILKDLNFTIPDGQFVILIGPSGCGKTTTMKLINRLLEPDSGIISINGKDIRLQDKVELRRHIGYVIQQIGLFPNMTVAQNISVVPKLLKYDKTRCAKIVQEMLKLVHMEDYAEKYPSELSGGQQQRIGVLRALAASPPIVLMDEPFGALDPQTREALQDEGKNLQQRLGGTIHAHQCAVRPTGSRCSGMRRADGTPQRGHPAGGGRMQPLCRNSFHRGYPRMG